MSDRLVVELPLRLPSVANLREHWGDRAKRAQAHRSVVALALRQHAKVARFVVPERVRVTITRCAPVLLDEHDNLRAACKAVADGVASKHAKGESFLRVDDADRKRIRWRYRQTQQRCTLVRIELEAT